MGLFDRKKKQAETNVVEFTANKEIETKGDFSLMVEAFINVEGYKGVIAGGTVHGTVKEGQTVFVIQPSGVAIRTDIMRIEIGPDNAVKEATDTRVALFLAGLSLEQVPKFTVITNVKPSKEVAEGELIPAYPQLLGLSYEYPKYCSNAQYMSLFGYVLCHAKFITPVNPEGTTTADENGSVNFYLINNSEDPDKQYLPLFASYDIMSDWQGLMAMGEPKTLALTFPDVVKVTEDMDGAVMNPFGPTPVAIPKDFIKSITSMEGYKKEFGNN